MLVDLEQKCAVADLDYQVIQELIQAKQFQSQWAVVSEATWDYPAVTQTIYVTEADQKAQEFVGKAMVPQVACVLKEVKADSVIVQPHLLLTVVSQPMVFAAPDVLATTAA